MNHNPTHLSDEPIEPWQLTAFALGELAATDANRIEKSLERDAGLRSEYEQIQQTIGAVRSVFSSTNLRHALDKKQSAIIAQNIAQTKSSSNAKSPVSEASVRLVERPFYLRKRFAALLATAAMLPLAIAYYWPRSNVANLSMSETVNLSSKELDGVITESFAAHDMRLKDQDANGGPKTSNEWMDRVQAAAKDVVKNNESAPETESMPLAGLRLTRESETLPASSTPTPLAPVAAILVDDAMVASSTVSGSANVPAVGNGGKSLGYGGGMGGRSAGGPGSGVPGVGGQGSDGYAAASGYVAGGSMGVSRGRGTENLDSMPSPNPRGGAAVNRRADNFADADSIPADSGLVGHVDNSFVPEMGLAIIKGSKQDVERVNKVIADLKDGESREKMVEQSRVATPTTTPAGGTVQLGGIKRLGEIQQESKTLLDPKREANTLMMTVTPRIIIPDVEEELLAEHKQLPEELRQNVPDAFRRKAVEAKTGDRFEPIVETPFVATEQAPLSTFSIDVDTASYSKIRQYLNQANRLPNPNMVRIEEMINYFEYNYDGPKDDSPFAAHMTVDRCPWNYEHRLVRIGLQARKVDMKQRPKANIVFLLDVSGSMDEPNKLPLVKKSLSMLASQLSENDRVAIVVYAGAAGCVLPSTSGGNKQAILSSLDHLNAGGSTNGGQGIQLAYSIAKENFIEGGINRVILCTDGDFNVGVTGDDALVAMMQSNAKSNIFLTCLGFGMGNYNDAMMEKISNQGNGIYGMIDNEIEARRMMVEQLSGTLVTVAKDVKIQIDFNPNKVAGYRLIGYEDRRLANKDFDNDQKDAGEIGAGHRVTALYEVIPVGKAVSATPSSESETSKYLPRPKTESKPLDPVAGGELASEVLTLKVRYKQPEGSVSAKQEFVLKESDRDRQPEVDRDMQWASAVAEFGLLLRHSRMAPNADWSNMLERAESATQGDAYRLECVQMMRKARGLSGR